MPVLVDRFGWFTLEIPDGWESNTEDSVTTLRGPLGVGVVYVSGGRHAGGPQVEFGGADFLARFLRFLGIGVENGSIESAEGSGCRIYSHRRESRGVQWTYWSVTDDETALLITYACDAQDAEAESAAVDDIVRSVRFLHSARAH